MDSQTPQIEDKIIPISLLEKNTSNPNKMNHRQFNLLVDNIRRGGFIDPIFVRPLPNGKYRIIGGHHRFDAAEVLGLTEVPCRVRTTEISEDEEKFQLMRMNLIRGQLDIQSFMSMYEDMADKYSSEELAESFGFEEEAAMKRLIKQTKSALPKEMKAAFDEGVKEVKTIADLSKLLNKLFSTYGDTLPYGYMLVDFGGKESVWLRMHSMDKANFMKVAEMCSLKERSVDGLFRIVLQLIADGKLPEVTSMIDTLPKLSVKADALPLEELADLYAQ